ncbi:MAG: Histidine triad (HIT) protein, partial [Microgenomates bacterium 39_7]
MNNNGKITELIWGKNEISSSGKILVLGSREISSRRVTQLTTQLASNTNKEVVWGCLEEDYIAGLEKSPQFKTLSTEELLLGLAKVDKAADEVRLLHYSQEKASEIINLGNWSAVIGINGSWHRAFHYRDEYRVLKKKRIPHKLVSAFVDESEAREYEKKIVNAQPPLSLSPGQEADEKQFFQVVEEVSRRSFDHTWQTGAALAKNGKFLLAAHNRVVPFETFALLRGASKEKHPTPPQDLNHYDTNHAEVELVLEAGKQKINLAGCSLYINLMPC